MAFAAFPPASALAYASRVTAPRRSPSPEWVLAMAVCAVGSGSIFARLADAPAWVVSFWRCALAAVVMAPLAAPHLRRVVGELGRRGLVAFAGAGFFLALHFATWIASLDYTSVASSVLLVNTNPLWVGLLSPLVTRDRIGRPLVFAIVLSLMGTAAIAVADGWGGGAEASRALHGDALALAGAVAGSLYLLLTRRISARVPLPCFVVLCHGSAALFLLAAVLVTGTSLADYPGETWLWLVCCAVFPQLLGHASVNWVLARRSAAMVSVALTGEPIAATFLAWAVLGERPAWALLPGGALVIAAVVVASRGERRRSSLPEARP